jgi:uncharacterized protein YndB with AHSA1/START domain
MKTMTKDTIEKTQWFPQNIDRVWSAITETEQVSKWLVPTDFKAEVGTSYALKSQEDGCDMVTGKVLEANPYKLVYSWINESAKDVETIITWTLKPEKHGTSLTMVHSGILKYSNDVAPNMVESYTGGWKRCFSNMTEILS